MYKGITMSYLEKAPNKDAPLVTYSTFINLGQRDVPFCQCLWIFPYYTLVLETI